MNILVRASADFESNITSVERIKEYCRSDNHEVFTMNLFNCSKNIYNFVFLWQAEWTIESSKPDSEWPSQGKIEFKDYSVKYREDLDNVLKNITCTINLCEKVNHEADLSEITRVFHIYFMLRLEWLVEPVLVRVA